VTTITIIYYFNGGCDLDTKTKIGTEYAGWDCELDYNYISYFGDDNNCGGYEKVIIDADRYFADNNTNNISMELNACWYEQDVGGSNTSISVQTNLGSSQQTFPVSFNNNTCCNNLLTVVNVTKAGVITWNNV
jgi:hypothetical protein